MYLSMDRIPINFYTMIHKELGNKNINAKDIPAILTRTFLTLHECTGSLTNPLVYLNVSDKLMIRYGQIYFTADTVTMPCVPLSMLHGSMIYIMTKGIYQPAGHIAPDDTKGIIIQPHFKQDVKCHTYTDLQLNIKQRNNTDIIEIVNRGQQRTYLHMNISGKLVHTSLRLTMYWCELHKQICLLKNEPYSKLDAQICMLDAHETLYLGYITEHRTMKCPYPHLSNLRDQIYQAQKYVIDIRTKFNIALKTNDPRRGALPEDKLLITAKQLATIDCHQMVKVIERAYWDLLQYIMHKSSFTTKIRKQVVTRLLYEMPHLLVTIPKHIFMQLYNWREHGLTNCICIALSSLGRYRLARQLRTAPFKPSPLHSMQSCDKIYYNIMPCSQC